MAVPKVTIIIPCRNEARDIERIVRALLIQDVPEGGAEVILADGMSNDGTREILARLEEQVEGQLSVVAARKLQLSAFIPHPSTNAGPYPISNLPAASPPLLRIIDNPDQIVSTGLNSAIRAARGEIIVRMDAHTEYAPDYVARCVETLAQTGADNVGGPARTKADTYLQAAVAAAYHSAFAVGGARFHDVDYEGPVDTVTYGCWRKESFEKFGYFDEELVRNQDDEHNLRISRGGGKIWQSPKIRSWYRPRGSLSALFRQYMQYGYWKVRVIQKHRLPASIRHLVPGAFVLTLLLLFLLSTFSFLLSRLLPPFNFSFQLSAFSFVSVLSAYALALITASLITASKAGWPLLPVLPAVFACYHIGYGWGFLSGIWDFVIHQKGPRKTFGALTR